MEQKKSNGKAVASMVLGIVSLVCIFLTATVFMGIVGIACGVVGLILGISANKEAKSGMATAGIVMSCIGLGLCAITLIACVACVGCLGAAGASSLTGLY